MHAAYFRPAACTRTCRRADRRHRRLLRAVPQSAGRSRTLLTGNRIFKQRNVDIGVVTREEAWNAWGFSGVMVRGSGAPGTCASNAALRVLRRAGFRHSDRQERRLLRPLSHAAWKRCASPPSIMKQCIEKLRAPDGRVRSDRRPQGRAAAPRRDEALDGSADPSLQALHRGLHVPAGEVYAAVEAPKGEFGVYLVPTAPTSPIAARSARRASRICRRWTS
jgi:NADH-quinone oxidoreductase subunit D